MSLHVSEKLVVFFGFEEVEKVMKAKKRKTQGRTVEGVEMVHIEKESLACETEGMLDTGKMYQVWFCYYLSSTAIFCFADLDVITIYKVIKRHNQFYIAIQ